MKAMINETVAIVVIQGGGGRKAILHANLPLKLWSVVIVDEKDNILRGFIFSEVEFDLNNLRALIEAGEESWLPGILYHVIGHGGKSRKETVESLLFPGVPRGE